MLVETFEMLETDHEGNVECDAEALALIESLDLAGQKSLVKSDKDGTVVRCPYRKMTKQEMFIYGILCPKQSKLKEYSDGPIPVRVLQVASHAVSIFKHVRVWSAASPEVKDPILVGCAGGSTSYDWDLGDHFILARWGEVLEPFSQLIVSAAESFRAQYKSNLSRYICHAQAAMISIDSYDAVALSLDAPSMPAASV